jgi:small GTP-binding protein
MFGMKVCLLGNGYVGKTSIKRRYLGMQFKETYMATIGADFTLKEQLYKDITIKYLIWDLAGQVKYQNIRGSYFMGAKGVLLVYDVTNFLSFEELNLWIEEFHRTVREKTPIILVGNKIDLRESGIPSVSTVEGKQKADSLATEFDSYVHFVETSAKTGENIDKAFDDLSEVLYNTHIVKHIK